MRRQRDRTRRLQAFSSTQLQRLKWKMGNHTQDWDQMVRNLEETIMCINPKFDDDSDANCQFTQLHNVDLFDETLQKHSRKPMRAVKVKKRRPTSMEVTIDPSSLGNSNVSTRRPVRRSLAFHRRGNTLKVIPLVEKRILEDKVKRGVLSNDHDGGLEIRDTSSKESRSINLEKLSRSLGRGTFQDDGSINIRLVDAEHDQSNTDHVMLRTDKDAATLAESSDPKQDAGDKSGDADHPAGSSRADSGAHKDDIQELKLWTYDDLMKIAQRLSHWMKDRITNNQPRGQLSRLIGTFCNPNCTDFCIKSKCNI